MVGAKSMSTLYNKPNVHKFIRRRNKLLAILGTCFGLITYIGIPPILDLIFSFALGTCFGIIGVNLLFEYSKNTESNDDE